MVIRYDPAETVLESGPKGSIMSEQYADGSGCSRRVILRAGAVAGLGAAAGVVPAWAAATQPAAAKPLDAVRVGFVGVGGRGSGLCQILMGIEGVQVKAVCDLKAENVTVIQSIAEANKLPRPDGYHGGPHEYRRLCGRDDIDLVVNATPWEWHAPICVDAMNAGKHVAVEVPVALTIEECWQLVETAERTGRHCMMLENVCYFRNVMALLNMVDQGLFGELVHCEAGYQHDLISAGELLFNRAGSLTWRGEHFARRSGNLYPTHPIGPVAWWMDINRGDRFDYLVSVSSGNIGLDARYAERTGAKPPGGTFKNGDINTCIIRTAKGRTVTLYFDTQLPRPYDMILRVQGSKGIYSGTLNSVYLEGRSPQVDAWEPFGPYQEKYDHPLWKALAEKAKGHSHGGGDYLQFVRLIEALRTGRPLDMDVYDAATWSVIGPMSERSAASRGRTEEFPDFTRGKWKTNPPLKINV